MQGMAPLEVTLVRVGLVFNEQADYHGVALDTGSMERRLEHLVPGIDLRAFLDQVLDKLRVALLHSVVQA